MSNDQTTKSALQNELKAAFRSAGLPPAEKRSVRPANGRRAALKGCATVNFATRSK
jgi:hypothetical protein